MTDKLPKKGDCYIYWLSDEFIDIRRSKIISYTGVEQKLGVKYIYTLQRYDIDHYEMYQNSLYFNDLIDPKFTRNESEIFDSFEQAVFGTLRIVASLNKRMVELVAHLR